MANRKEPKSRRSRKKVGRRAGSGNARATILKAALTRFADDGYEATTIRAVARDARVDPALVMHFYGSKEGLFLAMLEQRADASQSLLASLAGPRAGIGRRLTRAYFSLWEDPLIGSQIRSLVRAAIGSPRATAVFQGYLAARLLQSGIPTSSRLGLTLATSHLFGTAVARYILGMPFLSEVSIDELVRRLSPAIEKYLRATD